MYSINFCHRWKQGLVQLKAWVIVSDFSIHISDFDSLFTMDIVGGLVDIQDFNIALRRHSEYHGGEKSEYPKRQIIGSLLICILDILWFGPKKQRSWNRSIFYEVVQVVLYQTKNRLGLRDQIYLSGRVWVFWYPFSSLSVSSSSENSWLMLLMMSCDQIQTLYVWAIWRLLVICHSSNCSQWRVFHSSEQGVTSIWVWLTPYLW